jgi:hypothetical protein
MTGAQALYLKTLCEQAHRSHDFHKQLTKARGVENDRRDAAKSRRDRWRLIRSHQRGAHNRSRAVRANKPAAHPG